MGISLSDKQIGAPRPRPWWHPGITWHWDCWRLGPGLSKAAQRLIHPGVRSLAIGPMRLNWVRKEYR